MRTPYKIDNDELTAFIDNHPDAYLNEIAAHFQVTIPCISIALKRLKITRKKKSIFYKERDDIKCSVFLTELAKHEPTKLVYIDESGIDKFISREYGRCQRGQKIMGGVSGKRYARESFVAGQIQNKIIAPFCYTGLDFGHLSGQRQLINQ